jgi:hypothetical protein
MSSLPMEIGRIWQLLLDLSLFQWTFLGMLVATVLGAALLAIYMYGGLLLEALNTRRVRRVRREAWIDGHARNHD